MTRSGACVGTGVDGAWPEIAAAIQSVRRSGGSESRQPDGTIDDKEEKIVERIGQWMARNGGAIYGSPLKIRDGRTALANVYLAGTDQGFLGIVGAMLSGISMANFHVLAAKA